MRRMWSQTFPQPAPFQSDRAPVLWQGLRLLPGLNAVVGDEGSGKTQLLQACPITIGTRRASSGPSCKRASRTGKRIGKPI